MQLILCPNPTLLPNPAGQILWISFSRPHHHQFIDARIYFVNKTNIFEPVDPATVENVLHGCAINHFLAMDPVRPSYVMVVFRKATSIEVALNVTGTNADFYTSRILQMLRHTFYLTLTPMLTSLVTRFLLIFRMLKSSILQITTLMRLLTNIWMLGLLKRSM